MKSYTATDQQLHWLCQVIAKANRTFVPAKEDDSHTNLYFDFLGNRITGRWIQTESDKVLFTLNLTNLDFEIINSSQQVIATTKTDGRSIEEIELIFENLFPRFGSE